MQLAQARIGESFQWSPPAPGEYLVGIDPESLPEGWIGTGTQELSCEHGYQVGPAVVDASRLNQPSTCSLPPTVRLCVYRAASLSGYVVSAEGIPLEGATVRAQALPPGLERLSASAAADVEGRFRIEGLYPLVYSAAIIDPGPHAELFTTAPRPAPRLFDLAMGSAHGVELTLGAGPKGIHGRVIDGKGEGVADLSVLIYYRGDAGSGVALTFERSYTWRDAAIETRTDSDGRYHVKGLDAVRVGIQAGVAEAANGPRRRLRYAAPLCRVDLATSRSSLIQVEDIQIHRARRFHLSGRVDITGVGPGGSPLKAAGLELIGVPFERGATAQRPGTEPRPSVQFNPRTGEFTASCDAPRRSMRLQLKHSALPGTTRSYTYTPRADGRVSGAVLQFP